MITKPQRMQLILSMHVEMSQMLSLSGVALGGGESSSDIEFDNDVEIDGQTSK